MYINEYFIEQMMNDMRIGVDKVLSEEWYEYTNDYLSPAIVIKYIKTKYKNLQVPIVLGEANTNNWEGDWWMPLKIGDKKFGLLGSGFFGGIGFYLYEGQEE